MDDPVPDINDNPKYQTICDNHVTDATKFICVLSIVVLCLSSLGSFPFGLIITIPLGFAYYAPLKGIEELRPEKFMAIRILSVIHIIVAIGEPIIFAGYILIYLSNEDSIHGKEYYGLIILAFVIFGIELLWSIWCYSVISRCYQYLKEMKMIKTGNTQMI
uniref:Uncharacterized protein n=1 Tax=Panagrolaimus sp. ES5 TaxID=591445 RepID=A0AC34FID1_9BILA